MKQYKIYANQLGLREAIKHGWSWPAFFFNWVWAFIKKMNAIGGAVLGGYILLTILLGSVGEDSAEGLDMLMGLASLAVPVVFGVNGNAWREKNLVSRGYELKGTVMAESDEAAVGLYVNQSPQKCAVA
jgi:hypothetical protein